MQIEVIKVDVESKGKYKVATVSFKGPEGKVEQKNLISFGDSKEAYDKFVEATQGDLFEVTPTQIAGKDGKEYWHWKNPTVVGKAGVSQPGASRVALTVSPRSTYETPEERAKKQVYIVRQSSIGAAIELLALAKTTKATVEAVLDVAQQFEDYVFGNNAPLAHYDDFKVEVK